MPNDASYRTRDDAPARELRCFPARYAMNGEEWGFDIWAEDERDAYRRLAAIQANAYLDGRVKDEGIE